MICLSPVRAIERARLETRVTGWSWARAKRAVPKAGSPSPTSTRSPSRVESRVPVSAPSANARVSQMGARAELVEEGGGREQLLVRRGHPALVRVVAVQRAVASWRRRRRRRRRWRRRRRPSRRPARRAARRPRAPAARRARSPAWRRASGRPRRPAAAAGAAVAKRASTREQRAAEGGHEARRLEPDCRHECGGLPGGNGIITVPMGKVVDFEARDRAQGSPSRSRPQAPVEDRAGARRRWLHRRRLRDRRAASARPAGDELDRERVRRLRRHERGRLRLQPGRQRGHPGGDDAGPEPRPALADPRHRPRHAAAAQLPRAS